MHVTSWDFYATNTSSFSHLQSRYSFGIVCRLPAPFCAALARSTDMFSHGWPDRQRDSNAAAESSKPDLGKAWGCVWQQLQEAAKAAQTPGHALTGACSALQSRLGGAASQEQGRGQRCRISFASVSGGMLGRRHGEGPSDVDRGGRLDFRGPGLHQVLAVLRPF